MLSGLNRTGFGTGNKAHLWSKRVRQGYAGGTRNTNTNTNLEAALGVEGQPFASPEQEPSGQGRAFQVRFPPLPPPPTPKGACSPFGRAKHIVLQPGLGISTGTPPPSLMTSRYCLPFPVPLTAGKHANPQLTALIITHKFSQPRPPSHTATVGPHPASAVPSPR